MKHIQLYELVQVSNNSTITNRVLEILNDKLTEAETREFLTWLKIVKDKQVRGPYQNSLFKNRPYGY